MKPEGRKEGEDEVEPGRRVEDRILGIGEKRLSVSVRVRPEREALFFEEPCGQLSGRDLDQRRIPLIKNPAAEEEVAIDAEKNDQKDEGISRRKKGAGPRRPLRGLNRN